MVLYGAYSLGYNHRGSSDAAREYRAIVEAVRVGWGKENPAFRQLFTSRFIPEGTPEQVAWFNELCLETASAETAARLLEARADMNIIDLLPRVQAPTLVLHARDDGVVPVKEGRRIAASIPDAQFVELPGKNHVMLADEPGWPLFQDAVLDFLGVAPAPERRRDPFSTLSRREREVLALITEGLANAEIGTQLAISEKTVRNHISNVYDKLGVWTRAQALIFARNHGFRG